jgi:hypothetical protein
MISVAIIGGIFAYFKVKGDSLIASLIIFTIVSSAILYLIYGSAKDECLYYNESNDLFDIIFILCLCVVPLTTIYGYYKDKNDYNSKFSHNVIDVFNKVKINELSIDAEYKNEIKRGKILIGSSADKYNCTFDRSLTDMLREEIVAFKTDSTSYFVIIYQERVKTGKYEDHYDAVRIDTYIYFINSNTNNIIFKQVETGGDPPSVKKGAGDGYGPHIDDKSIVKFIETKLGYIDN